MAQTKYTYSVANDTANGIVSESALKLQIEQSAIVIALDYISKSADILDIYMKDALSAGDEAILDSVVASHDGVSPTEPPQIVDLFKKTEGEGIPKIAIVKPDGGDFLSIVTHDFCDKTTWFQKSVRVTSETMSNEGSNVFGSANTYWIDLSHGKVTREDDFSSAYLPKVYDNGVEQPSGFSINYVTGKVTFDSAPTGPVTCDYSYATSSLYSLIPESGKQIQIEHAELDFTTDVVFNDSIMFEIWAYNPNDLPNKVMVPGSRTTYKNMKDILKIANTVQVAPPLGEITNSIMRAVFNYAEIISLKSSMGLELRFYLENDVPFTGEFGTATLYTISKDE